MATKGTPLFARFVRIAVLHCGPMRWLALADKPKFYARDQSKRQGDDRDGDDSAAGGVGLEPTSQPDGDAVQ